MPIMKSSTSVPSSISQIAIIMQRFSETDLIIHYRAVVPSAEQMVPYRPQRKVLVEMFGRRAVMYAMAARCHKNPAAEPAPRPAHIDMFDHRMQLHQEVDRDEVN